MLWKFPSRSISRQRRARRKTGPPKVLIGSGTVNGIGPKSGRSQAQTAWLNVVFPALSECPLLARR